MYPKKYFGIAGYDAMNDQGEFSAPGGWATYFIIFQFLLRVPVIFTVCYKCEFTSEHGFIAAERHGFRQNRTKLIEKREKE